MGIYTTDRNANWCNLFKGQASNIYQNMSLMLSTIRKLPYKQKKYNYKDIYYRNRKKPKLKQPVMVKSNKLCYISNMNSYSANALRIR